MDFTLTYPTESSSDESSQWHGGEEDEDEDDEELPDPGLLEREPEEVTRARQRVLAREWAEGESRTGVAAVAERLRHDVKALMDARDALAMRERHLRDKLAELEERLLSSMSEEAFEAVMAKCEVEVAKKKAAQQKQQQRQRARTAKAVGAAAHVVEKKEAPPVLKEKRHKHQPARRYKTVR